MAEIIKKYEDTYIFEDGGVRFFLLIGENKAMMIDSGMNTPNALDLAKEITDKDIILVNTHCDMDHISGNASFNRVYMGIHEIKHYLEANINNEIIPLYNGDLINLGNREIEIFDLPGHTSGSIALLDKKHKILFSGDSIQRNGRIYMFGKERNMFIYHMSLKRLLNYDNRFEEIWPCHSELPIEKEMIHYLIEDSHNALLNKLDYDIVEMHNIKVRALKATNNVLLVDDK